MPALAGPSNSGRSPSPTSQAPFTQAPETQGGGGGGMSSSSQDDDGAGGGAAGGGGGDGLSQLQTQTQTQNLPRPASIAITISDDEERSGGPSIDAAPTRAVVVQDPAKDVEMIDPPPQPPAVASETVPGVSSALVASLSQGEAAASKRGLPNLGTTSADRLGGDVVKGVVVASVPPTGVADMTTTEAGPGPQTAQAAQSNPAVSQAFFAAPKDQSSIPRPGQPSSEEALTLIGPSEAQLPTLDSDSGLDASTTSLVVRSNLTGVVYSTTMMLHATPSYGDERGLQETHPEQPKRISRIFDHLKSNGCIARMKRIEVREVTREEVCLVHSEALWDGVQMSAFFTDETLAFRSAQLEERSSLYLNEHSAYCARLSCGGVIEMCDAVARGDVKNGFAIVRPPGHHAEPDRSMGFCFFNNAAVAAKWVRQKYGEHSDPALRCNKILILDWDVHHGNGTQSAFWEDESVLYISIHRYERGEFFPGGPAGGADQVGKGAGRGRNVNVPWPSAGMGDGEYLSAFQNVIMPIAYEFNPDFVIISAGFDAAAGDHLGNCNVSPVGYAHMTHMLAALAKGRLVVALEGGYNLDAIARSALAVTNVLLGEPAPALDEGLRCDTAAHWTIQQVMTVQSQFWKSITAPTMGSKSFSAEDEALPRIPLADILKAHLNHWLMETHSLYPLPVVDDITPTASSEDFYACQSFGSADLLDREPSYKTLLLFVHDMGNLRSEAPRLQFEPTQELGYLIDGSSHVLGWAKSRGVGVLDINVATRALEQPVPFSLRPKPGTGPLDGNRGARAAAMLLDVWDDYVELLTEGKMGASDVVIVAQGAGCEAVMGLLSTRDVKSNVRAVVQVLSHNTIPAVPKDNVELRKWYNNHSKVLVPSNHAYFTWGEQDRQTRRLGRIEMSGETRAISSLIKLWPDIEAFLDSQLDKARRKAAVKASSIGDGGGGGQGTPQLTNGTATSSSSSSIVNGAPELGAGLGVSAPSGLGQGGATRPVIPTEQVMDLTNGL